jgi:GNAT superfamily N-acetyltransferase
MVPIRHPAEVFDAIQKVKAGASAFCTNLFPVQRKLLRKDRDFWHLCFSASNMEALQRSLGELRELRTNRVVTDMVGKEPAIGGLLAVLASAGFRRHNHLYRMARGPQTTASSAYPGGAVVEYAGTADSAAILDLIVRSFDPYAEQLPMLYEIEAAAANRQVLAAKCDGSLAGLLFFETQGVTSTVRYWLVAERFRGDGYGGALMHRFFALHNPVRRFLLWVIADNENAIEKYRHYGFSPDGLVDYVLANELILS